MPNWAVIIILIVLLKLLINLWRYIQCKRFYKKYKENLDTPKLEFAQNQPKIIELFDRAGIEDSLLPYIQPMEYEQLAASQVSLFDNLTSGREDVVHHVVIKFQLAIGTYRSRMLEAINPIYWLEFIFFLPKNMLLYFGVAPEKVVVKIAQTLYWMIAGIFGLLFAIARDNILEDLKDWIIDVLQ